MARENDVKKESENRFQVFCSISALASTPNEYKKGNVTSRRGKECNWLFFAYFDTWLSLSPSQKSLFATCLRTPTTSIPLLTVSRPARALSTNSHCQCLWQFVVFIIWHEFNEPPRDVRNICDCVGQPESTVMQIFPWWIRFAYLIS